MKVNNSKKINKRIILIGSIIVVILALILIIYFVDKSKYNKYKKYEEIMDNYGLSLLYNNGSAKSNEKVTNIEALKILIAASYNNSKNIKELNRNFATDKQWYDYAKNYNIISKDEINLNSKVKLIEVIQEISNCKINILNKDISSDVKPIFSDYDNYEQKYKYSIMDLVSSEILENSSDSLDGKRKIRKGELNKLVIKFIEKYTLLNEGEKLLEDENKKPENKEEYPYILENVDKKVYEQEYSVSESDNFILPNNLYKHKKGEYKDIVKTCEDYYNYLLNIDYTTIDKESFVKTIEDLVIFPTDDTVVQSYIDHIVNNKISLTGKAEAQMPIIYSDGIDIRVRMKLEFNVNSSASKENVLYLDNTYGKNIIYGDTNTIYIDAVLELVLNSNKVFNGTEVVYNLITNDYKNKLKLVEK